MRQWINQYSGSVMFDSNEILVRNKNHPNLTMAYSTTVMARAKYLQQKTQDMFQPITFPPAPGRCLSDPSPALRPCGPACFHPMTPENENQGRTGGSVVGSFCSGYCLLDDFG